MVRPISQRTFNAVMLDSGHSLSLACMMDFSLDDPATFTERFGAFQNAARQGATVEDFDAALGSGEKMTALVAKYGSNVVFGETIWDFLEADAGDPEFDAHVDQQAQDAGYKDDEYPDDDADGDSFAMEMVENQDFAQDGEFENMTEDEGFGSNF